MLPKMMQKLFGNGGAGSKLRPDILPIDGTTLTINEQNQLEAKTSVTLSDAVDSTSSETAASSLAVKTAYDAAEEAQAAATAAQSAAATAGSKADDAQAAASAAQGTADDALAKAEEALNGAGGGSVTISDAVDSTSSTTAASSLAVKIAYDAAMTAQSSADAAQTTADTALARADEALNSPGGCVTCSIPVIEGADAIAIGNSATYTVSSVCGLQGAEITEFSWRLDEGETQTAVAKDGQTSLSLTLPLEAV